MEQIVSACSKSPHIPMTFPSFSFPSSPITTSFPSPPLSSLPFSSLSLSPFYDSMCKKGWKHCPIGSSEQTILDITIVSLLHSICCQVRLDRLCKLAHSILLFISLDRKWPPAPYLSDSIVGSDAMKVNKTGCKHCPSPTQSPVAVYCHALTHAAQYHHSHTCIRIHGHAMTHYTLHTAKQ